MGEGLDVFVTFMIADQLFGIPILSVQDILTPNNIAWIPLAPPAVKGAINLRGRIVTVIDVRVRLAMKARAQDAESRGVTVERAGELYTLLVDGVGDVISLAQDAYESNPRTLDPTWRQFANGVYRLQNRLMVVLDVDKLLDLSE